MLTPPPDPSLPNDSPDPRDDVRWSSNDLKRVDAVCEQFEQSCRANTPLDIRRLLADCEASLSRLLFRELLAIDVEYRLRRGVSYSEESLGNAFPEFQDLIGLVCHLPGISTDEMSIPAMLQHHPRYEITGRLGMGGMGTVFLGRHTVLGRDVAIKVIRNDLLKSPGARERFLREARTAARLQHPNVVAIYDAEATDDGQFLVMEAVVGADLARTVDENGPLPWEAACDAIQQAALGLEAARQIGLVHRDLSPRNLMLADDGTVKLLDFGLASLTNVAGGIDPSLVPGMLVGSAPFMSPEQADDPAASDVRSDLYGLGCVMYFLLTGSPPFTGPTLADVLEAHHHQPAPNVHDVNAEIPPAVASIVTRLLAKSPTDRFQTPASLSEALMRLRDSDVSTASREIRAIIPVPPPLDRNRQHLRRPMTIGLGFVILVALLWGLWEFTGRDIVHLAESPLYIQGQSLLEQRQESQVRRAIEKFQAVIQREPRHARAYSSLAEAYNLCGDYGWELPDIAFPKAIAAARQALELDPNLPEGRLALGFAAATYTCDWPEAEKQYRQALQLAPNLPAAHHWLAWYLLQQRRFDEALTAIERAQELAPDNLIIVTNVGKILYFSRRYAAAAEKFKAALELDQDFQKAHMDLGYALIELDQLDDALAEFDRAVGISANDYDIQVARALVRARQGKTAAAQTLLDALEPVAVNEGLSMEMAHAYAAMGKADRAIHWVKTAFDRKSPGRADASVDPRLDPLRKDPRFPPLLRSINLPPN